MPTTLSSKNSPINDAKSITASLKKSTGVMAATASTADATVSSLAQDGEIIEDTLDTHKYGLKTELKETKTALRKVKVAASREKWMIWGALGLFTTVVVYIIGKRTRVLTLLWLVITGTYHGTTLLKDLYKEGTGGGSIDASVDEHIAHLQEATNIIEEVAVPEQEHNEAEKQQKTEAKPHLLDFLEMEIDTWSHEVPMPPIQHGPLTEKDHEIALMYEKMNEEV